MRQWALTMGLVVACGGPPAQTQTPNDGPAEIKLAYSARIDGEIEPCG